MNDGLRLAANKQWTDAERAYRDVIGLRREFPEAWNGLEYLGEVCVKLGRLDQAREILARLRPLDAYEADELAEAIANAARAGVQRGR